MIYGFRQRQENARLIVSRIDLDALEEQEQCRRSLRLKWS